MRCLGACLLAVITACSFKPTPSSSAPDDAQGADVPDSDTSIEPRCFGTFKQVCFRPSTRPFDLGGGDNTVMTELAGSCAVLTIDSTTTGCVIEGTSVHLDGKLTGIGGLPLIVVATDGELIVDGLLDVSSLRGTERRGAGANPSGGCGGAIPPTVGGGGGGAGGSFAGEGGEGGDGSSGPGGNGDGGEPAAKIDFPNTLRGGCPGGLGGNPVNGTDGGQGGGAVWLIATAGITVSGKINASGAGGAGGKADAGTDHGGAGGGSGGMVVLDAPTIAITNTGAVMAQGGGGGGGNLGLFEGDDGDNPNDPGDPANGGNVGNATLIFGGNGGVNGDGGTGDTNSTEAACGGGGGVGFIRAFGAVNTDGDVFPSISS